MIEVKHCTPDILKPNINEEFYLFPEKARALEQHSIHLLLLMFYVFHYIL